MAAATASSPDSQSKRSAGAALAQPRKINLIDFRRQYEITLAQTSNFMRIHLNIHFAPTEAQIRMMALLLGHRAHPVHEVERGFEIGKKKALGNMMLFHNLPVRKLLGERDQRLALERWNATAARNTMLLG